MISLERVKAELRIDGNHDDPRLLDLIDEAIFVLQQFKARTMVGTVTDPSTQVLMTPLDKRFVYVYVAIQHDAREDLRDAYLNLIAKVRDGK
jgi:hypothetical protein